MVDDNVLVEWAGADAAEVTTAAVPGADSLVWSGEEAAKLAESARAEKARHDRAVLRFDAENRLRAIRDEIRGADDRLESLSARLASSEPVEFSREDCALLASCVSAEALTLTLAALDEIEPVPGMDTMTLLSMPVDGLRAFGPRDVPRLHKLAGR